MNSAKCVVVKLNVPLTSYPAHCAGDALGVHTGSPSLAHGSPLLLRDHRRSVSRFKPITSVSL